MTTDPGHRASIDAVTPLMFPSGVLARVASGMQADFLLIVDVRDDPIVLELATNSFPGDTGDKIQLTVDGQPVGPIVDVEPYLTEPVIPLELAADLRVVEGVHSLNYTLLFSGGGVGSGPAGQQFIVDYTPPGGTGVPPRMIFPAGVADGVTQEDLDSDANGSWLPATVERYNGQQPGDYIQLYVDGIRVDALPPVEVAPGQEMSDVELRIPRAILEAIGDDSDAPDGKHGFAYTFEDRAGNVSALSKEVRLQLRLDERIDDLETPLVPGADDGLVTDADTRPQAAVIVDIPGNALYKPNDVVSVFWNGIETEPQTIRPGGEGRDPVLAFLVSYDDVYDDWFATAGDNDIDVPVTVTYKVTRGGVFLGEPNVPATTAINLFGAGGKDPDPFTPVNEGLGKPVVRSTEGGNDNEIPADALDSDAVATIPGMRASDATVPAFAVGDIVQLYWEGTAVDTPFEVTTPGDDIQRTIPTDALTAVGPGAWHAHYTATRRLSTTPFENVTRSPAADVSVGDPSELPGGGDWLPYAVFREGEINSAGHLVLTDRGVDGTVIRIYAYPNMRVGDTIAVTWRPNKTLTGHASFDMEPVDLEPHVVAAADLVPKDDYLAGDPVRPPVPDMKVYVDFKITAEQISAVVSSTGIPGMGSARVTYNARNPNGTGQSDPNRARNPVLAIDTRNTRHSNTTGNIVMGDTTRKTAPHAIDVPYIERAADGGLGYLDLKQNPDVDIVARIVWDDFNGGDTAFVVGPDDKILGSAAVLAPVESVAVLIPAKTLSELGDGTHLIRSRVRDAIGSTFDSAPDELVIKLTVPGDLDTVVSTPYINENLVVPTIVPRPIDPATPSATVTIAPYAYMAEGDSITLRWGHTGNDLTVGPLAAAEVGKDVVFTVPRSVIDAGGVGLQDIDYQIYDIVGNWSLWSPTAQADITDPNALSAPYLFEADLVDGRNQLDMTALGAADPTAVAADARLVAGDVLVFHLVGTGANGAPVDYDSDPVTFPGERLKHRLPNDVFTRLIQGSCQLWYTITRNATVPARFARAIPHRLMPRDRSLPAESFTSRRYALTVTGSLIALAPPTVTEADEAAGTLDPAAVPNGAHVLIEANPVIAPDTTVEYLMSATGADGNTVVDENYKDITASTIFPLAFVTPANKIAAAAGGDATFSYTVISYDKPASRSARTRLPSPPRTYRVTGGVAPSLPAPTVPIAEGDTIDPARVDDAVGLEIDVAYTGMTDGDRITLTALGSATPAWSDTITYRGRDVRFYMPKTSLTPNDGGSITFHYDMLRDGKTLRSDDAVLHVGTANPFDIDDSAVSLTGLATFQRDATGGAPPYTYVSSAPAIVRVPNANAGGIESRADGAATITASDTAGAEGSYLVTVTGNALVLARPEPDFMDSQGNIDIGDISASTGLRVVVKQYTGMAVGQAITLTCYSAIGNHVPATQTVAALGDIAFHVPKSYIQDIVAALETPMAAFDYTVAVVGGATAKSPRTNVTFIG